MMKFKSGLWHEQELQGNFTNTATRKFKTQSLTRRMQKRWKLSQNPRSVESRVQANYSSHTNQFPFHLFRTLCVIRRAIINIWRGKRWYTNKKEYQIKSCSSCPRRWKISIFFRLFLKSLSQDCKYFVFFCTFLDDKNWNEKKKSEEEEERSANVNNEWREHYSTTR